MLPKQLGNYEIIEKIGAGGMGEVYRAHDSRLARDVALKILPELFAQDADRLARFEREARLLAALNHPGIGAIYGLEQAEGIRFLVLELVPGEDLSVRIARGSIPIDEALPIARDIAEAVEFAHEQGVVHRDLKPANVKITPEGRVKVLDFGLAKAFDSDDPRDPRLSQSPTILTSSPTIAGVILGTAAYMSPEQARGKTVDKRSDVFAFGCLLFEMLTGRQAFEGDTISDTLAAVLKTQPDLALLPTETPRAIRDLLKRCLEKDPKLRLRDMGEARIAIDHARHSGADETPAASALVAPARRGRRDLLWGAALLAVAAVAFFGAKQMTPAPHEAPLRKFMIDMEEDGTGVRDLRLALSPDGSRIAMVHNDRLWVRELSKTEAVELPGTDGADVPCWSPDGTQIAYREGATIHRIGAEGGTPTVVSATPLTFTGGAGMWWTQDGRILLTTGNTSLMQVPAMGGDPVETFPLPADAADIHEPSELPGGRGILFVPHLKKGGACEIKLWANGKFTSLLKIEDQRLWYPRYASTGHILFRRTPNNSGVWALPFSLSKLEVTGEPFLVVLNGAEPCPGPNGLLVHRTGAEQGAVNLAILSRDGTLESKISDTYEVVGNPALSPDGKRVAAVINEKNNGDIWVFDLTRGTRTRITFAPGWDVWPNWSPDGRFIYYTVASEGVLMEVPSDGSGTARLVHKGYLGSVSPDGKWLVYENDLPGTRTDLFAIPMPADTSTKAVTLVSTKAAEHTARISPDGKYVAYVSNESGQDEVYLTRFPEPGGKWQVSTSGGTRPRWDPSRAVLYYTSPTSIMEVDVSTAPSIQLGTPRIVLDVAKSHIVLGRVQSYEFFPGGKRVIVTYSGEVAVKPRLQVAVVENWPSEFKTTQMAKK
jgi:Tol biopolymer transport system component